MRLVPVLYRYAEKVIANSSELAEDLEVLIGRKVYVVHNPTINQRFLTLAQEKITEEWFSSCKGSPVILAVGRLSAQKDFKTLIKAFADLRRARKATLVILGEGNEKPQLIAMIKSYNIQGSVLMPGFVSNPYKFMKAADLFVLSSLYEGLPNVLIEALALGTNVVSTTCRSGPSEILNNGEFGKLVPVADCRAMSNAMQWVIDNPVDALAMTKKAINNLEFYHPEATGRQLIDVLDDLDVRLVKE